SCCFAAHACRPSRAKGSWRTEQTAQCWFHRPRSLDLMSAVRCVMCVNNKRRAMFEQIKQEIKADFFQQNFPNDGQRFVAWYLRNIHLRDMNETRDDITDGADDKQIDAIVIDGGAMTGLP